MKEISIILLCGGYGTRLQRDVLPKEEYKALWGIPKPLIPLPKGPDDEQATTPLISFWVHLFNQVLSSPPSSSGSNEAVAPNIYLVCNATFHPHFLRWAESIGFPEDHIFCDGTTTNEGRLGAVADLALVIDHFRLKEKGHDVLVVAGDTLFLKDFSLLDFLHAAQSSMTEGASLVTAYSCPEAEVTKTGILIVEEGSSAGPAKIVGFLEKPKPSETASRLACPCFYYLSNQSLSNLQAFLDLHKGHPLEEYDATGKYIAYLIRQSPVYSYAISGRLDIGDLKSYLLACEYLKTK